MGVTLPLVSGRIWIATSVPFIQVLLPLSSFVHTPSVSILPGKGMGSQGRTIWTGMYMHGTRSIFQGDCSSSKIFTFNENHVFWSVLIVKLNINLPWIACHGSVRFDLTNRYKSRAEKAHNQHEDEVCEWPSAVPRTIDGSLTRRHILTLWQSSSHAMQSSTFPPVDVLGNRSFPKCVKALASSFVTQHIPLVREIGPLNVKNSVQHQDRNAVFDASHQISLNVFTCFTCVRTPC